MPNKLLFIDRDGTLIDEPADYQIDHIDKLNFKPDVICALLQLQEAGYRFIMVSNQDGLGTDSLPHADFSIPHDIMLRIFASQGITFESIRICPHKPEEHCECRKPKIGLVKDYLLEQKMDRDLSYVIGDRETDMQLAENLGLKGLCLGRMPTPTWKDITQVILGAPRAATLTRKTKETEVKVSVNLDQAEILSVDTGIAFFDHMLEQLAKHGGFGLSLSVRGDLAVDDHHTVEDTAILLGETLRKALGDKWGIARYGFLLPMDESLAEIAMDLSGRAYFVFDGQFNREKVGELATELVPHFFRSFAEGLKATLHITVKGENNHHMIEAMFKGVGRALRQAVQKNDNSLPTTKGAL